MNQGKLKLSKSELCQFYDDLIDNFYNFLIDCLHFNEIRLIYFSKLLRCDLAPTRFGRTHY